MAIFNFKKKQNDTATEVAETDEKRSWFQRLRQGLRKTQQKFTQSINQLFKGKTQIDPALLAELEAILIQADMGYALTAEILQIVKKKLSEQKLESKDFITLLRQQLLEILQPVSQPLVIDTTKKPFVILVLGVNGVGKTTTIAKLAQFLQQQNLKIMLAAGDTFRAAAVDQLKIWGERLNIPVIAQDAGADSASVIYDAFEAAKARGQDVLICDTAGRLHTQQNLMAELKKIKRVIQKLDANAPHETLLILDANNGQNSLLQAKEFNEHLNVSGIVITKLDGTAKGGILFAISKQFGIPIRFVGVGEQATDLIRFDAKAFVAALWGETDDSSGKSQ